MLFQNEKDHRIGGGVEENAQIEVHIGLEKLGKYGINKQEAEQCGHKAMQNAPDFKVGSIRALFDRVEF